MKKHIIKTIISLLIIILSLIIFLTINYMSNSFGNVFTEVLFYLLNGVTATGGNALSLGIKSCIIPFIILFFYFTFPVLGFIRKKLEINVKVKNKNFKVYFPIKHKVLYAVILLTMSLVYCYVKCDVTSFLKQFNEETKIYDEYYVNPRELNLKFPEKKRNLVLIFAESLESTLITKEKGGLWDYSLVPELENLASDNINFSNNSQVGGAYNLEGTSWTVAAMVAQTAGVPMSIFRSVGDGNDYRKDTFMDGAYSLGDVLQENGYNLEIIFGSNADFGGRKQYFTNHGNYKIFDYYYAANKGLVKDWIWWGYEDYKMFDFAKDELLDLANENKPFNMIMLTADTHFTDGCIECVRDKYKTTKYDSQYENVYSASSKEINAFINWLKKQDFYKDTTVVIIGDHLSMQHDFFEQRNIHLSDRTIYNAIINSAIETEYEKNRAFSSLDMYPTILASMGVEIPGDRLGLGTNLYSGKDTLCEELGLEYVDNELLKKSLFYNKKILNGDYIDFINGN